MANPLSLSMSFHPGKLRSLATHVEETELTKLYHFVVNQSHSKSGQTAANGMRTVSCGMTQGEHWLPKEVQVQVEAASTLAKAVETATSHQFDPPKVNSLPSVIDDAFIPKWNAISEKYQKVNKVATKLEERVADILTTLRGTLNQEENSTKPNLNMIEAKFAANQIETTQLVHDYVINLWYPVPIYLGHNYWALTKMRIMKQHIAKYQLLARNIDAHSEVIRGLRIALGEEFQNAPSDDAKNRIQSNSLEEFDKQNKNWQGFFSNYRSAVDKLPKYSKELKEASEHASNAVDLEGYSIQDEKVESTIAKEVEKLKKQIQSEESASHEEIQLVQKNLKEALEALNWQMNRYHATLKSKKAHYETAAVLPLFGIQTIYTLEGKKEK